MTPLVKTRLTLVAIALMFMLPVILAWVVRDDPSMMGVDQTKNYGQLIQPAVPVDLSQLLNREKDSAIKGVKGRWTMLHVDLDGQCDAACDDAIKAMQQVHILLNKDMPRLERRVMFIGQPNAELSEVWAERDSSLRVIKWNKSDTENLSKLLDIPLQDGMILVMDPLGNIMMHYPQDFDPYGVQSDLRLLFKASQIG